MIKQINFVLALALSLASVCPSAEGTWFKKVDMPTARSHLSASVVAGKIYTIGGCTQAVYQEYLSTVEAYDAATDTWTRKADMPTGRARLSTSVVDGKIYAIGGSPHPHADLSTVELYDPTTDTWTTKADMPTARCWLSTSVVNGKIYAIGGKIESSATMVSTVEEYDPMTDIWTKKADMPTARMALSTNVVNGKIYAIGGVATGGGAGPSLSTVEVYDPSTDSWTRKADMPTARANLSAGMLNGKIYVIGGSTGWSTVFSTLEVYDSAMDTWAKGPDMPTARSAGPSAGVVDGKVYVIGGVVNPSNWAPTAAVEVYQPNPLAIDFNGDGLVDIKDLLRLIDSWGQDDPLVDIAPPPFGDGIVDVQDLELLMNYWEQPIDDPTLIAHWALDEIEGDVAYDSAGVNDAFVVGGAAWQPSGGQVDGALQLDGIDGRAITGPVLDPADGPFSVLAWMQGGAPGQMALSQLDGVNWLGADPLLGCLMTGLCASGRGGGPLQSETAITDGVWHRVGFVWDGLNRSLYVDDILAAQDTQQGLASSNGGLNIGCGMNSAAGTFWSGMIDEVRIYSRAISPY